MSLCQPASNFSCGACCGILNLQIDIEAIKILWQQRTEKFLDLCQPFQRENALDYRQQQESNEQKYPRSDEEVYVCPFLGYLDNNCTRIGCMIHPLQTGVADSQNCSFYGQSICQGYDCPIKESLYCDFWQKQFLQLASDSIHYNKLCGDPVTIKYIEEYLLQIGWQPHLSLTEPQKKILNELLSIRLANHKLNSVCSFEIDLTSKKDCDLFERMAKRLGIDREMHSTNRAAIEKVFRRNVTT